MNVSMVNSVRQNNYIENINFSNKNAYPRCNSKSLNNYEISFCGTPQKTVSLFREISRKIGTKFVEISVPRSVRKSMSHLFDQREVFKSKSAVFRQDALKAFAKKKLVDAPEAMYARSPLRIMQDPTKPNRRIYFKYGNLVGIKIFSASKEKNALVDKEVLYWYDKECLSLYESKCDGIEMIYRLNEDLLEYHKGCTEHLAHVTKDGKLKFVI